MSENLILILSTISDRKKASQIAHALVDAKLAACVNIVPGLRSIYRWKGKIWDEEEFLLVIKTVKAQEKILCEKLKELHPYELPEIISIEATCLNENYLQWVIESTSTGGIKANQNNK